MDYSEENLRDILELREWISEEIEKREKEIDKFRQNLRILDSLVKQSSFSKASSLVSNKQNIPQNQQTSSSIIPIKTPDNKILANAHVTSDELVIIPSEDAMLDIETHPFKSFFIGRIIGGMENQDKLDIQSGKIPQNTAIS